MLQSYLPIVVLFIVAVGLAAVFTLLAGMLGPDRPTPEKMLPYESGLDPVSSPKIKFSVQFYRIALLFLVFDIEAAFFYPWAVLYRDLSCKGPLVGGVCQAGATAFGILVMAVFLTILLLALAYVWKKESSRMGLEFATGTLASAVNWARKYSLFQYPFVTACCGMEFMAVWGPRFDIARFGAEFPRFSPRQADLLMVVGTITERQAPVLKRIYEQMCEPKWVVSFGVCASSGGFYQNYSVTPGIDLVIPVDVYIPGCPPTPEQVLDALVMLQNKIQNRDTHTHRDYKKGWTKQEAEQLVKSQLDG